MNAMRWRFRILFGMIEWREGKPRWSRKLKTWVVVGRSDGGGLVMVSDDGINWKVPEVRCEGGDAIE